VVVKNLKPTKIKMDPVSASFLAVFIIPVVAYVWTWNPLYLALFISIFLFGGCIEFIKILLGNEGKYARPANACQCDLLCLSYDDGDKPGYPSGHVAISTYFVGCMLGTILLGWGWSWQFSVIWLMVGHVWIYLIAKSRIAKKCHTLEQVWVGYIAGIIGVVSYLYVLNLV
jgi:hypothetical protein